MSSKPNWVLRVDSKIFKFLSKIPKKEAENILIITKSLSLNPFAGDIQKIKGEENSWQRRKGNFRIFYDIKAKERVVEVIGVERRSSATY